MTATIPPVKPEAAPKHRSPWLKRIGIGAAIVVALGAGVGIGAAGSNQQSQLNAANAKVSTRDTTIGQLHGQISSLQGQIGTLQSQNSSLQSQYNAEKNTAQHALSVATAKVKAQDAARQAQLNSEAANLKSQQQQLAQLTGMTQNNQISQDGVYIVGHDMKGGTWHTSGGSQCYYALLASSTNTSDVNNIITNDNFSGPNTVSMGGAYAFDISGGCTWVKIG
jgi:hypothetical protein